MKKLTETEMLKIENLSLKKEMLNVQYQKNEAAFEGLVSEIKNRLGVAPDAQLKLMQNGEVEVIEPDAVSEPEK